MSSKQSTSKPDPRIAKKEVMVTRHKSAQMKRQLRVKDRSMKHLTDLLKSPTKETQTNITKNVQKTKTSPKLKQSFLKSVEKVQRLPEKVFRLSKVLRKKVALLQDEEYHPNKKKRKQEVKKVVLKPNHELQPVASIVGSVKRKCRVPHKASPKSELTTEPEESNPVQPELTIAEVIRLMEDDLTDEDLMEILTCPSPVWWEDGPGEEYIEEAIFKKSPEAKTKEPAKKMEIDTPALKEKKAKDQVIEIPNLNKKSDKFLKKRSKLEDLLGNIKSKSNTKVNETAKNAFNKGLVNISSINKFNEDLVVICSNYRKEIAKAKGNKDYETGNKSDNDKDELRSRKSESDGDEIIFHDSSMNEDELLRDLENMDIPIESRQTDVIVIDDDDDDSVATTSDKNKEENASKDGKNIQEHVNAKTSNDKLNVVPTNIPVLQKCFGSEVTSPNDSCSLKTSKASQDADSISDTNIKFIIDDEMDEHTETTDVTVNEKAVVIKTEKDDNNDLNKEMAVYRIVEEASDAKSQNKNIALIQEKSNQVENDEKLLKINDYYKKCKKVYQKKAKKELAKTDENKNDVMNIKIKQESDNDDTKFMFCESCLPKIKQVSDDKNVKYCLKCSSIFDSTDCIYCIEKTKRNVFTCVPCKTKFCCQPLYKAHYIHIHVS